MLILEDTRQQENRHNAKHKYFIEHGIQWNRTSLYCGDYTLPANQSICVDTKKDIQELIGDIQVKSMAKKDVEKKVFELAEENHVGFDLAEKIYHMITDDDLNRFAEKDINDICFKNGVLESVIAEFQTLYVKRYGFFHRGLKRAENSGIKLIILVENEDGITNLESISKWENPRLNIWKNSNEIIGLWNNGRPKYKKIQKFPNATKGETLAKSLVTMQEKYGTRFEFCSRDAAGRRILELLGVAI